MNGRDYPYTPSLAEQRSANLQKRITSLCEIGDSLHALAMKECADPNFNNAHSMEFYNTSLELMRELADLKGFANGLRRVIKNEQVLEV